MYRTRKGCGWSWEASPRFEQNSVHCKAQHSKHGGADTCSQPEGRTLQVRLAHVSVTKDSEKGRRNLWCHHHTLQRIAIEVYEHRGMRKIRMKWRKMYISGMSRMKDGNEVAHKKKKRWKRIKHTQSMAHQMNKKAINLKTTKGRVKIETL